MVADIITSQVAKLTATNTASRRRQRAAFYVLIIVALGVAAVAIWLDVYCEGCSVDGRNGIGDTRDLKSFASGLAFAMLPAMMVWAVPLMVFVPRTLV